MFLSSNIVRLFLFLIILFVNIQLCQAVSRNDPEVNSKPGP